MVNIVDDVDYAYSYRETNQQFAKENSELRQQLGHAIAEINSLRQDIHRRDVENVDLREQLNQLIHIKSKYDRIVDIIEHDESIRAIEAVQHVTAEQNVVLTLPDPSDLNNNDTINRTRSHSRSRDAEELYDDELAGRTLNPICEMSEEEEESPSPSILDATYSDSLDPPNVSVSPLKPERLVHTPSVFHCLDTSEQSNLHLMRSAVISNNDSLGLRTLDNINSPIRMMSQRTNILNHDVDKNHQISNSADMFQSTPVQNKKLIEHESYSEARKPQLLTIPSMQDNLTSNPDNQENVIDRSYISPAIKKKRKPIKKEVKDEPGLPRYNLRKRSKLNPD